MGIFNSDKKKQEKKENKENIETIEQAIETAKSQEQEDSDNAIQKQENKDEKEQNESDFVCYIKDMFDVKDGGSLIIGQVLLGQVKENDKVLYVTQKARVLGGCTVASIDQGKNRVSLAYATGNSEYGCHYGFYLPELSKEEIVKGNLLVSSSMLEGDRIEQLNVEELVKKAVPVQTSKLSPKRKGEIGPIILKKEIEKDMLTDLTIQEVLFLICSLRAYHEKSPMENFESNEKVLYETIIDKIKTSEKFYVTIDKTTGFPFINTGFVDLYSTEQFANEAADFYAQRYRKLEVREISHCMLPNKMNFFIYLYIIGAEKLIVDNGQYRCEVNRFDILPPPDYSNTANISVPIFNPSLRFSMIDFFSELRWSVNYSERPQVLKKKEDIMIEEICKAKYLLPMKYEGKAKQDGDKLVFQQDTQLLFAKITNEEDETYIPAFTDWLEFEKAYDKNEWHGVIMSILDAIEIGNGDGVVINPYGESLLLNDNNMKQVKEECERLNITKRS